MKNRNSNKSESEDGQRRLAVLIDADNAQPSVIEGLLAEVAKYGVASVKRIYGDFTSTRLTQWKQVLLKHSINPVQQFTYTSGKNATDSSLIIDAMDLMYTARFDGVCLVSSDSDFTRLAQRMREEGLIVYGFGERKTPDAFVQACDKFIYTEVLRAEVAPASAPTKRNRPVKKADAQRVSGSAEQAKPIDAPSASPTPVPTAVAATSSRPAKTAVLPLPLELLRRAIEEASDEQGWAHLGAVGSYLTKIRPDFDPRLYGHRKLSDLLKRHAKHFAVEERGKTLFVRAVG
ncbi:MAG TPA: NYN domain-containing protein [Xanthomonadaceae bacterium]|nr:NYN domain-containing protein [Xanthomonadaceae bacterium]